MPLTADHIADVAIHTTIAGVAVWQTVGWLMVAEMVKPPDAPRLPLKIQG